MKTFELILMALLAIVALAAFIEIAPGIFTYMAEKFAEVPHAGRRQAGFILLSRATRGYQAGQIVEMPKSMEDAIVAGGGGTVSAGPVTAGALTTDMRQGGATIAAAAGSVVITNPCVSEQSVVWATIAQATADGTALYIARVVPANGSFTIHTNANATAALRVKWAVVNPMGVSTQPT